MDMETTREKAESLMVTTITAESDDLGMFALVCLCSNHGFAWSVLSMLSLLIDIMSWVHFSLSS